MAKTFARCKLCNASKFLNSISLCKRCAKTPASAGIRAKAMKANAAIFKAQAADQGHIDEEKLELKHLEEHAELTSAQKTRLEELVAKHGSSIEKTDEEKSSGTSEDKS